jgi:hypothetical protein
MIEAAIASDVARDEVASALVAFVPFFTVGIEAQVEELATDRLANVL